MFCTNCGEKTSSQDRFCSACGTRLEQKPEGDGKREAGPNLTANIKKMIAGGVGVIVLVVIVLIVSFASFAGDDAGESPEDVVESFFEITTQTFDASELFDLIDPKLMEERMKEMGKEVEEVREEFKDEMGRGLNQVQREIEEKGASIDFEIQEVEKFNGEAEVSVKVMTEHPEYGDEEVLEVMQVIERDGKWYLSEDMPMY